jgi:Glycosyl hydrolases family 39
MSFELNQKRCLEQLLRALVSMNCGGSNVRFAVAVLLVALASSASADWRVLPAGDQRQPQLPQNPEGGTPIKPGDPWPTDKKFRWLIGDLQIPDHIGDAPTAGQMVGLQLNCGDGGEVYVGNKLESRFDNDHPALAVVAERAVAGAAVRVVAQIYGQVQGGDRFGQANWVIIDSKRGRDRLVLTVDPTQEEGPVANGLVGLSQGGGLADYEDATARKLKEGGFKWFRMDNVFTPVLKQGKEGGLAYDWTDFDRRLDFLQAMGAEAVLAVSYMPQALDAVPNPDRQSAPRDYGLWEELCFQAARRALDRGRRVAYWEVWNEVNTGWLKPGPEDAGGEVFRKLYEQALGKPEPNLEVVRRFEAYCKLYRATARGVLRADPRARIGGPALASGPMENVDCGHCSHGKGFARGLMLWCQREKLPLDFLSWHEYFQSPETMVKEAQTFRTYLEDFPNLKRGVSSLMVTEWNEAWWADRPQDHEVGAAWCANSITRAFIPARIDRPCFFYVKQGDTTFRGDYSLLMKDNLPKASYNVAKIFNGLSGTWVALKGTDDDVSGVAAWDASRARLAVVLVNFRDRYALRRHVRLEIGTLPAGLVGGAWREWTVDATHANVWNDPSKAELRPTGRGSLEKAGHRFQWDKSLEPNSVTLLELIRKGS